MPKPTAEAGPSYVEPVEQMLEEDLIVDVGEEEGEGSVGDSDGFQSSDEPVEEFDEFDGHESSLRADLLSKDKTPSPPMRRVADPPAKSSSWTDLDLSIIVALVSPIGNWLTGGDHIKNVFLIILLIFYLHQIIEIPWQLYLSARPRKAGRRAPSEGENDEEDGKLAHFTSLAKNELRRSEVFYLCLSIASPFIGAYFLRRVLAALGDSNTFSWFSTTLFVLATGIRPWSHFVSRLKERTHELHTALHYPDEDSLTSMYERSERRLHAALQRVDSLEREVAQLRKAVKRLDQLREVCDDLTDMLGNVERSAKRYERKADAARIAQSGRITLLEQGMVHMEERRKRDVAAFEAAGIKLPNGDALLQQARSHLGIVFDKLLALPRTVVSLGLENPDSVHGLKQINGHANANGVDGADGLHHRERHLAHLAPRLATIPEADDSDSEGTFVSDKEASPHSPRKRSKSTGSSASEGILGPKPRTVERKLFDFAQGVLLWPYRFSVRFLVAVLTPLRRSVPRV